MTPSDCRVCMSCYDVLAIRDWHRGFCSICHFRGGGERVPEPMKDPVGYVVCERFTPDADYFYPDSGVDELVIHKTMTEALDVCLKRLQEDEELRPTDLCLAVIYKDRASGNIRIPTVVLEQELPPLPGQALGSPNDFANEEESSQYD